MTPPTASAEGAAPSAAKPSLAARVRAALGLAALLRNPVLVRELSLMAHRGRVGWGVLVLTVTVTLVIASTGGAATESANPATVGASLYTTFFTLAHVLVLLLGPAIAAGSVASEREGRTFEALLLTGMPASRVALGKAAAAVAQVGTYALALAPVGALPFLFGGVPALAVPYAFVSLAVAALLGALTGLAISAKVRTTRAALVLSVAAGALLALCFGYGLGDQLGRFASRGAGAQYPGAMWLPLLLATEQLAWSHALPLLFALGLGASLLGWFLLEACVANLADRASDRASGLKRWYVASALLSSASLCAVIAAQPGGATVPALTIDALLVFTAFGVAVTAVFLGDELVAPRRVRLLWQRRDAGVLRRFFGPGLVASATLQLVLSALGVGAIAATGLGFVALDELGDDATAALGTLAVHCGLLLLAAIGGTTYLRTRLGASRGRLVYALALVVLTAAPYAAKAILGGGPQEADETSALLAAPSPLFAIDVARDALDGEPDELAQRAGLASAAAYALLGLLALWRGTVRTRAAVREAEAQARRFDERIEADERALVRAVAPSATGAPATSESATSEPAREPAASAAPAVEGATRDAPAASAAEPVPDATDVAARPAEPTASAPVEAPIEASPASEPRVGVPTSPGFASALPSEPGDREP